MKLGQVDRGNLLDAVHMKMGARTCWAEWRKYLKATGLSYTYEQTIMEVSSAPHGSIYLKRLKRVHTACIVHK